jgi:large subunit ribosomal protein L22
MTKVTASTVLNKSPQKVRLIINPIRRMRLDLALETIKTLNKGKTKKVYDLLMNAANNLKLTSSDYNQYLISEIWADEAQKLYRIVPRARGSAFKIRRRHSNIKVRLQKI